MNTRTIITLVIMLMVSAAFLLGVPFAQGVNAQAVNGLVSKTATTFASNSGASVFAAKFRKQLDLLNKVKIDDHVFSTPSFNSLIDWSRPLPVEPAGRPNPFAPL
jgi:hypothetical protein